MESNLARGIFYALLFETIGIMSLIGIYKILKIVSIYFMF
jgi:hypothetical protein